MKQIVEAALDGRQRAEMTPVVVRRPVAVGWCHRAPVCLCLRRNRTNRPLL